MADKETKKPNTTPENSGKKTLSLSNRTMDKVVDGGRVRQSFSHGRSKTVAVEVKRRRTINVGGKADAKQQSPQEPQRPEGLSDAEWEARLNAFRTAAKAQEEVRKKMEEEAKRRAEEAEHRRLEQERREREVQETRDLERTRLEEEERQRVEQAEKERVEKETRRKKKIEDGPKTFGFGGPAKPEKKEEAPHPKEGGRSQRPLPGEAPDLDHSASGTSRSGGLSSPRVKSRDDSDEPAKKKLTLSRGAGGPKRRDSGLTLSQAQRLAEGEDIERTRSLASIRRARQKQKSQEMGTAGDKPQKVYREVVVPETITVQELASRMSERGADVVKKLMQMGVMAKITQAIDADTAELVVEEFGHTIKRVSESDVEDVLKKADDDPKNLKPRPPVVTVMGHVDHGKTSLLDALRKANVVSGEAGGITQHIGAYQVTAPSGKKITFIDTPGHAAFTQMRARGAKTTDIVILVVAADDGIMEQTKEAINHAKTAEVPIIVAINKMDTPGADPSRVRTELLQHEIVVEEMGGDVLCVEISAKQKTGLDKLEEAILLQAELLDLKANPTREAEGAVVESKLEKGRGAVATILIQRGTLKVGDIFVAGCVWGRVRALINDQGKQVKKAGPAEPIEILGIQSAPDAGDEFAVVESEAQAREITEFRLSKRKNDSVITKTRSIEDILSAAKGDGEKQTVNVVIKGDVQGSVEAIATSLQKLETDEVGLKIVHGAVGEINESDITLAGASEGVVIAFNVRANQQAKTASKRDGVEIRYYSVIYDLIEDIKAAMEGLLSPTLKETFLGYAGIKEVFNITKVGKVAGCEVTEGVVKRGMKVRLLRDNVVIHEGSLKTLKRFQDEVKEVRQGQECGMAFENYQDIRAGDVIECFSVEEIARTL